MADRGSSEIRAHGDGRRLKSRVNGKSGSCSAAGAGAGEAGRLDLQPFDRAVDIAHRTGAGRFLTQYVPGLQRLPQLDQHPAVAGRPVAREAKFDMGRKPALGDPVSRILQITGYVA